MDLIIISEEIINNSRQKEWFNFLSVEKFLVEQHFDWLNLTIDKSSRSLIGKGILNIGGKTYRVLISFSPFYRHRFDRIYIDDTSIVYNRDIHLYADCSLCLYHPIIDQALLQKIPLFRMIPWITEWIVFYEQWKKYGIWLGKEIKH